MSEFKVGDKVVRLDVNSPYIYSIQNIKESLITIVRKKKTDAVKVWGAWVSESELRHATPEEIKAGRRL